MEDKIKKFLKELRLNESLLSTAMGVVVVFIIGTLLFKYFSQKPTTTAPDNLKLENITDSEEKTAQPIIPEGLPSTHKVIAGEHLWKIAENYYGSGYNWVDIAQENNLKKPDLVYVGQELMIPAVGVKKAASQIPVSGSQTLPTISGDRYQIQSGDNLWTISVRAYSDGFQWIKIYNENITKIGQNPDLIYPGLELDIPRQF